MNMEIKERVITEATRMFSEMGIKSVRMDDIAVACGISKRTLYENFADREDLVRQSIYYHLRRHEEEMLGQMKAASNVIDEFWIMFGHSSEFRASTKLVVLDLIKYYPQIFDEVMRNHYETIVRNNEQRLRKGIEQGLFLRCIDTELMARSLTRYLYGLHRDFSDVVISAHVDDNKPEPRPLQLAIMFFLRGITTEKGREYIDGNILKGIE